MKNTRWLTTVAVGFVVGACVVITPATSDAAGRLGRRIFARPAPHTLPAHVAPTHVGPVHVAPPHAAPAPIAAPHWPFSARIPAEYRLDPGSYYRSVHPKYQSGFHARDMQNLGVPTGDVGLRGNGMFWTPW
jgi:hypothetical protein